MDGLKVNNWQDWENLCCYFMQHIALGKFGQRVEYQSYGSQGQSQFGIDLVPLCNSLPVVGQCKLREKNFTWDMVLTELEKTDGYQNNIEHYFLFTTANPHTTVQNEQNLKSHYHLRPDGSKFQVHVCYWRNIKSLDFVPREVLERIFPDAFVVAAAGIPDEPSSEKILAALPILRAYIPRVITAVDLEWLENWDFSCGYVPELNYDPFNNLYIEHDRVVNASNGIPIFLYEGNRNELAAALPAGVRFFEAIGYFRDAIYSQTIGDSLPDGTRTLSLKGLDSTFVAKTTSNWKSTAAYLARVYREDVLGEPRS